MAHRSVLTSAFPLAVAASVALAAPASALSLSTGVGDGDLTVGVDLFGAFGSSVGGADTTDAFYDPVGTIGSSGTVYESAIAISFANIRGYLNSGDMPNPIAVTDPVLDAAASVPGQRAVSTFTLQFSTESNPVAVRLVQEVTQSFEGSVQVGSALTQTYTFTNIGTTTTSFDVVRYIDGDLQFDNDIDDVGGRLSAAGNEILYETEVELVDVAVFDGGVTGPVGQEPGASATFLGITAVGGATEAGNRYQISSYSGLRSNIESGLPLADFIENDTDGDQTIDVPFDVTMALRNVFSIPAGQSRTYTTQTLFGNAAPPTPGSSEVLPLLPTEQIDDAFVFSLDDLPEGETIWFDPIVTVGFDYEATDALIASITAPSLGTIPDADGYLILFDGMSETLLPGEELVFGSPLSSFRLTGIDPSLALDPDDPLAFPLGINYASILAGGMLSITPITLDVDGGRASIPLPGAAPALLLGLAGIAGMRLRRKAAS